MTIETIEVPKVEDPFQEIEEMIVLTKLKPGVMYSEKQLAEMVGYGRTPVREALQRLENEGLVSIKQRRGIQITEVDVEEQLRLLEIRRPLQNFIAEYAATHAIDEDRQRMNDFGAELLKDSLAPPASRIEALSKVRLAHDLVVSACHNEFAEKTMRSLQGLSRRFWIYYMKREDYNIAAKLHALLLVNVAKGDCLAAKQSSNDLIDYLESFAQGTKAWK